MCICRKKCKKGCLPVCERGKLGLVLMGGAMLSKSLIQFSVDGWGCIPSLLFESESEVAQSCLTLYDPWTVAHQAPPSMGFSRQEYWSGLPFPSPGDLPDPGIEPRSPTLQADALTSAPPGKPGVYKVPLNSGVIRSHCSCKSHQCVSESESVSHSIVSDSLRPHELYPARLLCPWDSPGKNIGMGSQSLLQGIFPT